ncbi:MAG: hypothetical protein KJO33_11875 [Gammaproteobacteria bacterium]|nr:hypothetical protein [Gammaproteobacteria bacterium]
MSRAAESLRPPRRSALLLEARAAVDLVRMVGPLVGSRRRGLVAQQPLLVMLVPGFGTDDRYLSPLRRYLGRNGFRAEGWGLGKNLAGVDLEHRLEDLSASWEFAPKENYRGEASVPYLSDRLAERVRERHGETDLPVALVGWSLGGFLAREVARDLPGIVDRVVTFGSPTIGGPKYTAAAPFFRKRGMDLDWIEREISRRESRPIRQPITAIYSRNDGIVSWRAAQDHHSPNVRHVEVDAAHMGMGFKPEIWSHVLGALESENEGAGGS